MSRALARMLLAATAIATSLYALLCSLPFAWNNFIQNHAYPDWLGFFLRWHAAFAAVALIAAVFELRGRRRAAWLAISLIVIAALIASGGPSRFGGTPLSLAAAIAALLPYLLWEALLERSPAPDDESAAPAWSAAAAGMLCAAGSFLARLSAAGAPPNGERAAEALALGRAALDHAGLFLGAALILEALRAAARGLDSARLDFLLRWALLTTTLRLLVLDALSAEGPAAWPYSAALGLALAVLWTRCAPRLRELARSSASTPGRLAASSLALFVLPAAAHLALRGKDWNRLIETLAVLSVWVASASLWARIPSSPPGAPRKPGRAAVALALTALLWGAEGATRLFEPLLRTHGVLVPEAVRTLAERDVSLGTLRRILHAPMSEDDFYAFLRRNTSLPRGSTKRLEMPPPHAQAPSGQPPHIFIIAIDSLRADHVGAYDSSVRFTPRLDAFAREADVFRGFTAYGGTALSEPALWAGALLPHEQYPTPFQGLNALEKLLQAGGYRPLVTMDVPLTRILDAGTALGALDSSVVGTYKLCDTLKELGGRLDAELAAGRPLFVYTQPQDIHISVISHEGAGAPDDARWQGRYAPYAWRVSTMDGCFGSFIDDLKRRRIYDDSIVVLTSDHGDSLGEEGRWGHAYALEPEVIRVPLMLRLPPRLRASLHADLEAPAFTTDIAPSLYAALGLPPLPDSEPFGRALYARDRHRLQASRRDERLISASYGPVYALLGGGGDWLFIADSVAFQSRWYDLRRDPHGRQDILDAEREAQGRRGLRAQLDALRAFYGY